MALLCIVITVFVCDDYSNDDGVDGSVDVVVEVDDVFFVLRG